MVLLLWAYFAAVLVDPGHVPPGWHPFGSDEARCCGSTAPICVPSLCRAFNAVFACPVQAAIGSLHIGIGLVY